jgi:hypothetical protein
MFVPDRPMASPNLYARLPLFLLLAILFVGAALTPWPNLFQLVLASESGIIEIGTVLAALAGAVFGVRIFFRRRDLPVPALGWWFLAGAAGLLLFAGEELSWGQHWLNFGTPDVLATNVQGEANLHNLSLEAEQIPKMLLFVGVLIGGVISPLALRLAPATRGFLQGWFGWLWPQPYLWPPAAIAMAVWAVDRLLAAVVTREGKAATAALRKAIQEGYELFLLLFVALYLVSVWRRLRAGSGRMAGVSRGPEAWPSSR